MTKIETDRETLINSLKASKGWTTGYATAFVDTFSDHIVAATLAAKDNKYAMKAKYEFDRYPYLKK